MSNRYTDQEYAMMLGGVFQAAKQVFELAYSGQTDEKLLDQAVQTLFQNNPDSVRAVYGEIAHLRKGLKTFAQQLENAQDRNPEITQYSIRLLQLGYKLFKDPQRLLALTLDLEDFESRMRAFGFEADTRYSQLAAIYQDHISKLGPRIMVKGDPALLQNNDVAARIRVALLTGIRSAFLWYQCGGKRWHLITRQKRLLNAAHQLLEKET